jgi:CheY-like chemotaxis protein
LLAGRRVLVVEDDWVIRALVEDMLAELGCEVAETAAGLDEALAKARGAAVELAVLDVNLDGRMSFAVADALAERGIAFVFATGYGDSAMLEDYRHVPLVEKPFAHGALERALLAAMGSR